MDQLRKDRILEKQAEAVGLPGDVAPHAQTTALAGQGDTGVPPAIPKPRALPQISAVGDKEWARRRIVTPAELATPAAPAHAGMSPLRQLVSPKVWGESFGALANAALPKPAAQVMGAADHLTNKGLDAVEDRALKTVQSPEQAARWSQGRQAERDRGEGRDFGRQVPLMLATGGAPMARMATGGGSSALGQMAGGTLRSGREAVREAGQLGQAVRQGVRDTADQLGGMVGPQPAFAGVGAGRPPALPAQAVPPPTRRAPTITAPMESRATSGISVEPHAGMQLITRTDRGTKARPGKGDKKLLGFIEAYDNAVHASAVDPAWQGVDGVLPKAYKEVGRQQPGGVLFSDGLNSVGSMSVWRRMAQQSLEQRLAGKAAKDIPNVMPRSSVFTSDSKFYRSPQHGNNFVMEMNERARLNPAPYSGYRPIGGPAQDSNVMPSLEYQLGRVGKPEPAMQVWQNELPALREEWLTKKLGRPPTAEEIAAATPTGTGGNKRSSFREFSQAADQRLRPSAQAGIANATPAKQVVPPEMQARYAAHLKGKQEAAAAAEAAKNPPLLVPLQNSQFPEYGAERRVMGVARPEWVRYADPDHVPTYALPSEWSRPPASAEAYRSAAARASAPPPYAGGVVMTPSNGVMRPPASTAMTANNGVVSPGSAPMRTRAERDALVQQFRALNQPQGGGAPQNVVQGGPVPAAPSVVTPAAPPVATPAPTRGSRLRDMWRRFMGR